VKIGYGGALDSPVKQENDKKSIRRMTREKSLGGMSLESG